MDAPAHQVPYLGARLSPLPPVGHPYPAADPLIQLHAELIAVGDTKVVDPAAQVLAGFEELILHRHAPVAVGQSSDLLLEALQGFRVNEDLPRLEGKPQELTLRGFDDMAFAGVDHQFQTLLQVAADAGQYALSRSPTPHQYGEVIGIAGEGVATLFQLFVQWVEHDVGQQRR